MREYERCLEILVQCKNHKHIRNSKSLTHEKGRKLSLKYPKERENVKIKPDKRKLKTFSVEKSKSYSLPLKPNDKTKSKQ